MRLSPLSSVTLGLLLAGCAATPALLPREGGDGSGVTLHLTPRVQAARGGYGLRSFSPFDAGFLHRLVVTVTDVTATPTLVTTAEASSTTPLFSGGPPPAFLFGNLRPYRVYRVAVQGYGEREASDKITVDDLSSTIVDTMPQGASGAIPTWYELVLPVQLADRPFAGRLDVLVEGFGGQTGVEVALQGASGANPLVDLAATTAMGSAALLVHYEGLALDSTYRVVRRPFYFQTGSTTPIAIPEQVSSAVVTTASDSTEVEEWGEIASRTLPNL